MIARLRFLIPFFLSLVEGEEQEPLTFATSMGRATLYPPIRVRHDFPSVSRTGMRFGDFMEGWQEVPLEDALTGVLESGRRKLAANCLVMDIELNQETDLGKGAIAAEGFAVLSRALDLLRWRGQQYYIQPLDQYVLPWLLEYAGDVGKSGEQRGVQGEFVMRGLVGFVSKQAWIQVGDDLELGAEPPLPETLLDDALSRMPDVRSKMLTAWIALETFIRQFCDEEARRRRIDATFWNWLTKRDDDIDKQPSVSELLDGVLRFLTGSSMKTSRPDLWEEIQLLKKVRNMIAHEGKARYKTNAGLADVDEDLASHLLSAVRDAFDWCWELRGARMARLGPVGSELFASVTFEGPS